MAKENKYLGLKPCLYRDFWSGTYIINMLRGTKRINSGMGPNPELYALRCLAAVSLGLVVNFPTKGF